MDASPIVADLLASRRSPSDTRLPSVTSPGLTLAEAYELQRAVADRHCRADGDMQVGWKVGLVDPTAQRQVGVAEPIAGRLFASQRIEPGGSFSPTAGFPAAIECEIGIVIGRSLGGPDVLVQDVVRAATGAVAAFEIIEERLPSEATIVDMVADNCSGRAFVTGPTVVPLDELDRLGTTTMLESDGTLVRSGVSGNVLGDPARAVAWLAAHLASTGDSLLEGQLILTGATAPPLPLDRSSRLAAMFGGGLGEVELNVGSAS